MDTMNRNRGGARGTGSGGFCICVRCGHRQPHERGRPCLEATCPACGAALLREGSWHHQQYLSKGRDSEPTR
jgi:hypothetical protein